MQNGIPQTLTPKNRSGLKLAITKKPLDFYLEWLATLIIIVGAIFTSTNVYPLGPILLNLGSLVWLIVSIMWRKWSLIVINGTLLCIYSIGLIAQFLYPT